MEDQTKKIIRQLDADITGMQWIRDMALAKQWDETRILKEIARHKRNIINMKDNQCQNH